MIRTFLYLHLAVFLAGFTGVFGRLISYDAFILVFIRFMIAALVVYAVVRCTGKLGSCTSREKLQSFFVGSLLALHLVFFYLSIKLSNISIGTITLAAAGFFTSFIEPKILGSRFSVLNVIYTLICVLGLLLIFNFDSQYRLGIAVGIFSAFLTSLFSIFNKKFSYGKDPYTFLSYEMIGGFCLTVLILPVYLYFCGTDGFYYSSKDIFYLILLSTVFTAGLYFMVIQLARTLSAFTISLTFNLEPIYAIIVAMIMFKEASELGISFYVGLLMIIVSVLLQNMKFSAVNKDRH
ncbi:MAG: DMT family transporter [Succinivibrio sp.]